jgi:MFS family permease
VLGVRMAFIGLIDGVAETTASLIKIYSGALSDKIGKRKWLAVLGYAISTVAKPFLYFANAWGWVLGIRFADRVGKGIRTAPRDALVAASTDVNNRGFAFGLHRAGDTAGAFIGIGIAALIIWLTQTNEALLSVNTFRIAVLASIVPAGWAVSVLAVGAADLDVAAKGAGKMRLSFKEINPRFRNFLFIMILFTLGNSSDSFIILRAQERGLNVLQTLFMLMTFTAIYTLLSSPLGSLSDRVGRRTLIIGGWLAYAFVYLGFALASTGWQIWMLFGLYGIFYGTAYGLVNAAVGITALPASLLAGLLWQGLGSWTGFGPSAPFFFGAALALIASLLLWRQMK